MAFKLIFLNDVNFNFRMNRLLSYGSEACDRLEVLQFSCR